MSTVSVLCIFAFALIFSAVAAQRDPHFVDGRTTIVHLFEWKWNDIADECERFLGPHGYGGVQVSPPNENKNITESPNEEGVYRPWWERYQPISYKLITRSGNEEEFKSMVQRCNAVGVRIYVDAVINHMTYGGKGFGVGGSTHEDYDYPAVPYSKTDFNCPLGKCGTEQCRIWKYDVAEEIRNCELELLDDLDLGVAWVREKLTEYLNKLISYGVAGFRIDAAKHMWPADILAIVSGLDNLSTEHGFSANSRAFIYQEVIDMGNEAISSFEYLEIGKVTEFKVGRDLGKIFRREKLAFLYNFGGLPWGMLWNEDAFIFIDNHDNQRGHGAGGADILTHMTSKLYKMATAFILAFNYGQTRVMSSYAFVPATPPKSNWEGPPHDANMNTLPVVINEDNTCGNGWICEHRWRQIYNMVAFRNVAGFAELTNWFAHGENQNQIAFARQGRGFIAINNAGVDMVEFLQTTLPAGTYCDVISGNLADGGACTGKSVTVNADGFAQIQIGSQEEDGILAIHVEAKV